MNCTTVLEKLSLVSENELPAEEMLFVRAHLAECQACGAAYRDMTRLVGDLRRLPRPTPPADLRARIDLALDVVDEAEQRAKSRSVWELVGPYVAAAAVIAMAFGLATVLSRPRHGGQVARVPANVTQSAEWPAGAEAAAPEVSGTPVAGSRSPEEKAGAAVEAANRRIREFQDRQAMKGRDEEGLWPPGLESGRDLGAPVGPPAPRGTRPGTFAVDTGEPAIEPLRTPTQIDVSFLPPDEPMVGRSVHGVVKVSARDTIGRAVVTASGDEGLAIDKPDGVLYSGPLRAGEEMRVPLPMTASTGGLHEIHVRVESDAPGGNTDLKAFVPNFRSSAEPAPGPSSTPADKPVNLVFKNAPVRQALLDIAKQAGLRIEMAEGLGAEKVSQDVRGVPARAALRAVAEQGGYQVDEAGEVFTVTRASGGNH